MELDLLTPIRSRLSLARTIDLHSHASSSTKHHNEWFVRNAQALDLELDDTMKKELFRDEHEMALISLTAKRNAAQSSGGAAAGTSGGGPSPAVVAANAKLLSRMQRAKVDEDSGTSLRKARRAAARERDTPYIPVFTAETATRPSAAEAEDNEDDDGLNPEDVDAEDRAPRSAASDGKKKKRPNRKERQALAAQKLKAGGAAAAAAAADKQKGKGPAKASNPELESLRRQLRHELAQPLISTTINRNYFTLNTIVGDAVTTSRSKPNGSVAAGAASATNSAAPASAAAASTAAAPSATPKPAHAAAMDLSQLRRGSLVSKK